MKIERRPFKQARRRRRRLVEDQAIISPFADYHDPERVHWGKPFAVWKRTDEIAPGSGFPPPSSRQHGNHHLFPRWRDHAQGQPG